MRTEKEALVGLLDKYSVPYCEADLDIDLPLQPWRCNRKYIELEKMISSGTLENPCLLRFCHLTDARTELRDILYREFDLAEFVTGHKIVAVHAVFTHNRSGSVIIKLDNGVIGSVEVSNQLPETQTEVDRHEIVAQRGVASDIVVDTQIPQQSIYLMTQESPKVFTDTDGELYGLDDKQIERVRSRFAFLKDRTTEEWHIEQDAHIIAAVNAAMISNETHKKIIL